MSVFEKWINTTYNRKMTTFDLCDQDMLVEFNEYQQEKIDKLEAKLKIAEEGLNFYATEADLFEGYPDSDISSTGDLLGIEVEVLGKRARRALMELEK